jgi:Uma2 family endonuclease
MSASTRLTFAEFETLPEKEGVRYELDEGTLLLEPSPALNHNLIRQRIASHLTQFVRSHSLGIVVEEMDFRLETDTVRNPDVAFITADHLRNIDPYASPVEGAPALAIEVISPSNLAQDTAKKVRQYLAAGCQAVWLVYPALRLVEVHDSAGARRITEPESIAESGPFSGFKFSFSLTALFDDIFRQ